MFPPKAVQWMKQEAHRQEAQRNAGDFRQALKKAYKGTIVYELDKLAQDETKWARRITVAHTKLKVVRRRINKLALELAQQSLVQKVNVQ